MRRPGGLWRHRDFLSLWGAETISQFGTQVSLLALPLVAIIVLEESAFKVAALTSVEFLPFLLFTLPAGVWIDRLRRKPILVLGNVGRGVALLSVPIAHWAGGTDDLAALRRRLHRRGLHRLLRHRLPVVHPGAGREGGRRRGELQARDQPSGRQHRRPGHGRRPGRSADCSDRRARRRGQLRGLGAASDRDPQAGRGAAAGGAPVAAGRARRGPPLRLPASLPAHDGGDDGASRTSSARSSSRSCSSTPSASSTSPRARSGSRSPSATWARSRRR